MSYTDHFMQFIEKATTPIQSVSESIKLLETEGFTELEMNENWSIEAAGSYYVRPFPTTLIAFKVASHDFTQQGFKIITSHTDNPGFKVKPNPEMTSKGFLKLNTEVYCQPIYQTWYDRPLSLAGRVLLKSDDVFAPKSVEVDLQKPILVVPSLAIHFNREVNKGVATNPQKDMLPIMNLIGDKVETDGYLVNVLADEVGCAVEDILDYDLYVYVAQGAVRVGQDQSMVLAPRVDNQSMVYASVQSLIDATPQKGVAVAACFDNEEIGSTTKQGADSMLLYQVTERIGLALKRTREQMYRMWNQSFLISADGAHSHHPNVIEKNDVTNITSIGRGISIKVSAKQSYTTDGESAAIFKQLCNELDKPYQHLVNRSDIPGGKTLGPISTKYIPIKAVDVGIPMLGMHSAAELFGESDFEDCVEIFKAFYSK